MVHRLLENLYTIEVMKTSKKGIEYNFKAENEALWEAFFIQKRKKVTPASIAGLVIGILIIIALAWALLSPQMIFPA